MPIRLAADFRHGSQIGHYSLTPSSPGGVASSAEAALGGAGGKSYEEMLAGHLDGVGRHAVARRIILAVTVARGAGTTSVRAKSAGSSPHPMARMTQHSVSLKRILLNHEGTV